MKRCIMIIRVTLPRLKNSCWTQLDTQPARRNSPSANTAFVQHHGQQPRSSKTYQGLCQHASRDFRSVLTLVVGHQADTSVGSGRLWSSQVEFIHSNHFYMAQKCKEFASLGVDTWLELKRRQTDQLRLENACHVISDCPGKMQWWYILWLMYNRLNLSLYLARPQGGSCYLPFTPHPLPAPLSLYVIRRVLFLPSTIRHGELPPDPLPTTTTTTITPNRHTHIVWL